MYMNVGMVPLMGEVKNLKRVADYVPDMRFKRESLIDA